MNVYSFGRKHKCYSQKSKRHKHICKFIKYLQTYFLLLLRNINISLISKKIKIIKKEINNEKY